jgi:hypothetical protein
MRHGYRITRVVTPAASMALVSLDDAKTALGIDAGDTSQDATLTAQIEATSMAINNFCDRIFVVQTYRDQLRDAYGVYGEPLVTRQYPIMVDDSGVPVVAVSEDSGALDAAFLEVYPEQGALYRLDASMLPAAWGAALVVVDYTAGYTAIPPDVMGACLEWLSVRWHGIGHDPSLRSETIPDLITQVYDSSGGSSGSAMTAMPGGVRDWLAPYRIWSV